MAMVDSGGLPPGEARIEEGVCVPESRESIGPMFMLGSSDQWWLNIYW